MRQYGVEEKSVCISVEGCTKELRQAWCWMGDSKDGFQLKKDSVKAAHCHRFYTAYTYGMGMMEELEGKGLGVMMDGTWCGGLMCADDIVLLAETATELRKMLDLVGQYAKQRRF